MRSPFLASLVYFIIFVLKESKLHQCAQRLVVCEKHIHIECTNKSASREICNCSMDKIDLCRVHYRLLIDFSILTYLGKT